MIRRTVGTAAAVSTLLAVAACSTTVSGTPSPDPQATAAATSSPQDVLNALDACTVLNQLVAGQGFDPGVRKTARNECHVSKSEYGTLSLALDPVQGLADFQTSAAGATQLEINGRRALIGVPAGPGTCAVVLEVAERARAMAGATMLEPERQAHACPAARDLAAKLEPLLPR